MKPISEQSFKQGDQPEQMSQPQAETDLALNIATNHERIKRVITPLEDNKSHNIYDLEGFAPIIINAAFLTSLGIDKTVDDDILKRLEAGSQQFVLLYENRTLTPDLAYDSAQIDLNSPLEIHNYTGMCPTYVQELTPSRGACSIACQYCLVTDGDHRTPTTIWENYPSLVSAVLEEKKGVSSFYYFSPKTEAFSEPHLETGIAHDILQVFVEHFSKHPDSRARIFIATKAGTKHLSVTHNGKSILDLLTELKGKVQINGSIGIMPVCLREVLEPNAASIEDRLEALQMCQKQGLFAESVLAQPLLLPYMTDEVLKDYFEKLQQAGIRNIKPEFLTVEIENLACLAQFIHHFNPELLKAFLEVYIQPDNQDHRKQRFRLAPARAASHEMLLKIQEYAKQYGVTISICNWVKQEIGNIDSAILKIDEGSRANGYRCLGYQKNLL